MPFSDVDIVQVNSGGFQGTTGTASLGSGTTAGNTILIFAASQGQALTLPTGFVTRQPGAISQTRLHLVDRLNCGAGENNWTIGSGITGPWSWIVYELAGLWEYDVGAAALTGTTSGTTMGTGTSPLVTSYDSAVFAVHVAVDTPSFPTLSGQTGGFTEQTEQGHTGTTKGVGQAISIQASQAITTFASTATVSVTLDATDSGTGWVCAYAAPGAKRVPDIAVMFGAEVGTTAGWVTGNAGARVVDAIVGSPTIVSTSPRSGTYCLEVSAAAAAESIQFNSGAGSLAQTPPQATWDYLVARVSFMFPSSLPAGDVELLLLGNGASLGLNCAAFRYESSTSLIGVEVRPGGTEVFSATTVAADTWYNLDVRFRQSFSGLGGSTHTWAADWQLDGVDQTQAVRINAAGNTPNELVVGWQASGTATVRYDDLLISKVGGSYPLGDHNVLPLKVDPAGTLTISGTTANFQTFTANGTLVAWNATTARNNIDDVPVTLGAGTSDGFAQITSASTNYVEIPMETYQAAPDNSIRAVRVYVPGWSPSATAQGFGLRSHDGTTEHTLFTTGDPNFDNSTTAPAWVCRMAGRTINTGAPLAWTQTKLDALAFRVGFSNAAQDVGIHSILAEVAVQPVEVATLFGDLASAGIDPVTGGVVGVTVDTTVTGATADLTYEEAGSPTTVNVAANDTVTEMIEAPDAPTVNRIELQPEAEPPP